MTIHFYFEDECGRGISFSGFIDPTGRYLFGLLDRRSVGHEASAYAVRNKHKTGNVRINVTLRRVRGTIVAVKIKVLRDRIRKAHAPYYIVICGLSGSTKFFHIIS